MSIPQKDDILVIPAYTAEDEETSMEISWSQMFRNRTARFYMPRAKNQTRGNADVLLYVQDSFLKDESNANHISKIPGARKEGENWLVPINDRFQYGQKNASGESRFVVLHDKDDKMFQHRFLVTTIQGNAAGWAKTIATNLGYGDIANNVSSLGTKFVGDYMKTF